MAKHEKADVDYSQGHADSRCGICRYFVPAENACTLVKGSISANMWCRLFRREK